MHRMRHIMTLAARQQGVMTHPLGTSGNNSASVPRHQCPGISAKATKCVRAARLSAKVNKCARAARPASTGICTRSLTHKVTDYDDWNTSVSHTIMPTDGDMPLSLLLLVSDRLSCREIPLHTHEKTCLYSGNHHQRCLGYESVTNVIKRVSRMSLRVKRVSRM